MSETFVIIGAGQAGGWVAKTLRAEGFAGRIVLIGSEAHCPYERPPLSKSALVGGAFHASETVLEQSAADAAGIEMWLGSEVTAIDRDRQTVCCSDGKTIKYDRLFLTMGSSPRRPSWLPSEPSDHIHLLRTRDDAVRLRGALLNAERLLVVGGGWIGLETAASARKMGLDVVVYEAAERICARSLPKSVSEWLTALHERNGVEIVTSAAVAGVQDDIDGVTLVLGDGTLVTGDLLLVGIGNVPNVGLAEAAGLVLDNGIVVDASGRTSDSIIFAAGDVTNQPCVLTHGRARRESWANAQNQAIVAAKAALGQDVVHDETPWLWSDQYDANIQILGLPEQAERLLLHSGTKPGTMCWLAVDGVGSSIGAISVNAPRELRTARKLIAARAAAIADWA